MRGARRLPGGRGQPPPSVLRERHLGIVRFEASVPQLAGHLLVPLVETLAVVRELAAAHEVAVAQPDLAEPVGVGEASGARPRRCRPRLAPGCPPPDRRSTRRRSSRPGRGARPRGGPPGSPRPAARCVRTGRARRTPRSACTRSRTRRCTDRRPRRSWAAWRPRIGRPSTRTGSRRWRSAKREPEPARRRRRRCRPPRRRRRGSGCRPRSRTRPARTVCEHLEREPRAAPAGSAVAVRRRFVATGRRPSCRRARSAARRRRSPPRARGAPPPRRGPAGRGADRGCAGDGGRRPARDSRSRASPARAG